MDDRHTSPERTPVEDMIKIMGILDTIVRGHIIPGVPADRVDCTQSFAPLMALVSKYQNELQMTCSHPHIGDASAKLLQWTYLSDSVDEYMDMIVDESMNPDSFYELYKEHFVDKLCAITMAYWTDLNPKPDKDAQYALEMMNEFIFNKLTKSGDEDIAFDDHLELLDNLERRDES